MDLNFLISLLVLGTVGGFLAGLLGIGGGMFLVPALTFLLTQQGIAQDMVVKMAIATSLATIIFTSLSSVRAHQKRGNVNWKIVKRMAPALVVGTVAGAQLTRWIPGDVLAKCFAVFVAYSALQMFIDKKPKASREFPGTAGTVVAGTGIGVLSALVGAGGGFVTVPFMVWCNINVHRAVATSAALGFPIAVAGTIGYVVAGWSVAAQQGAVGFIYLPAVIAISVISVLFAPLGAAAAQRLNVKQLEKAFAFLLFGLAVYMMAR